MKKSFLSTFFEPIFHNKKLLVLSIFTRIILSVFGIINIFFLQKIVVVLENGDKENALQIAIFFTISNLLFFIFNFYSRNLRWICLDLGVTTFLRDKYMNKFNTLNNIEIETQGTGRLISIIPKGIEAWGDLIYEGNRCVTNLFVSLVAMIIVILQLGKYYFIVAIFLLLFVACIILKILISKTAIYRKKCKEEEIGYDRQFTKMIMNKFEILQNKQIKKEIKNLNQNYKNATMSFKKVRFYIIQQDLLPKVFIFLIYISFLLLMIYGNISLGIILSFLLILGYVQASISEFVWFFVLVTRKIPDVEKVIEFFGETSEIHGLKTGKNFVYKNGDFELKNISFGYGNNSVFGDFSLKIQGSQVIAFVGESGGGKTTLMKLFSGFIAPNSGEIIIDGQKLSEINLMSYYKEIGYLTQEPSVFDGTILENLTYGSKEEVSEKMLRDVIKKAKCEFIFEFKKGLETEIGERGVRLSGGQKQRLAIAKIFLKNPKIIFLDEPTSALDSQSEKLIHESFQELFKGKTVIIIAHRLQTVKSADEIFVIKEGKVIEKGNHKELLLKKGYYNQMIELQSGF